MLKKMLKLLLPIVVVVYFIINWNYNLKIPNYESVGIVSPLPNEVVDEASGIADSRTIERHLWIHNDGGNPNEIYLFSHNGNYKGVVQIPFPNRDWEDMCIATDENNRDTYIYIADIGDNQAVFKNCFIYRFKEPTHPGQNVEKFDRITFKYEDGPRDAEAMMIDPRNNDIYIITKREMNVRLYKLPYPQDYTNEMKAQFIEELPYYFITSAGISTDGREIMIRNYGVFYYWYLKRRESISEALNREHDRIFPYVRGYQEEGFCFDKEGDGFFSIGERLKPLDAQFYYFKKEISLLKITK